jgi:cytoskeletal protein CcmA (bactofilin family)
MPRFKRFRGPRVVTVIGHGTSIDGDLQFTGGLHLDGTVRGNVNGREDSAATLTVSDTGLIEGDVRVENLVLNGTVNGDVFANGRAELAPQARVSGTLHYRLLEMALGAEVNGKLVHVDDAGTQTPDDAPAADGGTGEDVGANS